MSSKGSVNFCILVQSAWAQAHCIDMLKGVWNKHFNQSVGVVELYHGVDDAGYLEGEVKWFASEIERMGIPAAVWTGSVDYLCYDCSGEDGERVSILFENGKIAKFEESRMRMVECLPWEGIEFDTTSVTESKPEKKPEINITVSKTLTRGMTFPGTFDEAVDWVAQNWEMIDFGEGTRFSIEVSDDETDNRMLVGGGVED